MLYIVHIARYALRIAKCTCYFTCANLNASRNTLNVLGTLFVQRNKNVPFTFNALVYALCAIYSFMLYALNACEFGEIGRSEAA